MAENTWKGDRLGPYHLGRQCEEVRQDVGRLYEARNGETGRASLVLLLDESVQWQLEGDWWVRLSCKPRPASVMLDVEQAPESLELTELGDLLALASAAVQRVEHSAQVQAHFAEGAVRRPERWTRRVRRLWASRKGRAVAGVALLALGWGVYLSLASGPERSETTLSGRVSQTRFQADAPFLANNGESSAAAIAYPMPALPFRNQAVAPCKPKLDEVEINGGCWLIVKRKPPCLDVQAEYQGECYVPVSKDRGRPAQSAAP